MKCPHCEHLLKITANFGAIRLFEPTLEEREEYHKRTTEWVSYQLQQLKPKKEKVHAQLTALQKEEERIASFLRVKWGTATVPKAAAVSLTADNATVSLSPAEMKAKFKDMFAKAAAAK
jgi:hypothetical protein